MNNQSGIAMRLGLVETVKHWSKYLPNKPAIVSDTGAVSYRELYSASIKTAAELVRVLPKKEMPIGLMAEDKPSFVIGLLAIPSTGNSMILLNPIWPDTVLAQAFKDSGAEVVLIDAERTKQRFEGQHVKARYVFTQANTKDAVACGFTPQLRDASATWGVIYSSGTTSQPKGIVRTDFSILSELLGWCLELPITREDSFYIGRPLFYTGGLVLSASTLLVGGTVCAPREHEVKVFHALQSKRALTYAFLLPDQIRELVRFYEKNQLPAHPVKRIVTMGAAIAAEEKQKAAVVLKAEILESWGNSEGLGTITEADDLINRPASIGRPFLGDEMLICDDSGKELPAGSVGRISGLADSRLKEYRNREDLNNALILGELVLSEDLGKVDNDGYFHLCGRLSERIVRRGNPVFANDILPVVRGLQGVQDAAVIGIPDGTEGEVPVAAVVISGNSVGVSEDELLRAANAKLSELLQLRTIRIVPKLEKTATGKLPSNTSERFLILDGFCYSPTSIVPTTYRRTLFFAQQSVSLLHAQHRRKPG